MNVVNSLHPNFSTAPSMAWSQSAATTLFTISAEYAEASTWQFRHHIVPTCHCVFETPQTWSSWDLLLAILCAWTPCTPTSLPCSRIWVNTLLIRNAEAKAWTARMTARASTSEPLVARTLIMKESRMRTGPFGFHGSSSFHDVQSTKSSASPETKQWSRHPEYQMKIDQSSRYSVKYPCYFGDLHYIICWYDTLMW